MHPRIPSTPISRKLSSSLVKRSCERPCASGAPPIPEIPKNHANPASDNPPNARKLSSSLVKHSHERPCASGALPSQKSQKILQILLQTFPQSLINSRHLSSNAHTSAPAPAAPSHPKNPPKSCKSCFRQSPQSLVNSRHLSSNTHTSAPAPAAPLPSRKSPKNHANPAPDNPPNARNLSCNSRDLSSNTHTSAPAPAAPLPSRKSPKILQILLQTTRPTQITAHPQYPMTSYKRCYYPLSTIHYPLVSTKNLPTARSGAFVL